MDWNELLGDFYGRSSGTPIKRRNLSWINTLFSGASGVLGTILQNVYNTRQIESTNKANKEIVEMQNQAAAAESEKAYKRSLPQNQVANMMNAGMSRAGAINALNGGGHYQPAPVSASMEQAPQIDLSSAINAVQASAQLAEQKRQFNIQLAEQKRQFDAQHELQKEESKLKNSLINHQIYDVMATYTGKEFDNALKNLEYNIQSANAEHRVSAEKSELIARDAEATLNALKAFKQTDGWSKLSSDDIAEYYKLQAKLEVLAHLGNTKATDLLAKFMSLF